jgi:hypothetical protein
MLRAMPLEEEDKCCAFGLSTCRPQGSIEDESQALCKFIIFTKTHHSQAFPTCCISEYGQVSDSDTHASASRAICSVVDTWLDKYSNDFCQHLEFPCLKLLMAYLKLNMQTWHWKGMPTFFWPSGITSRLVMQSNMVRSLGLQT